MSTVLTQEISSTSSEDTLGLAHQIGACLKGGEVIELSSDLGGGKTTFVKGLVEGMGSNDNVSSPSFTIGNQYTANSLTLYHFDFYRISDAGIMRQEIQEIMEDPKAVIVIEWAGLINDILPLSRLSVTIDIVGEDERDLTLSYPDNFKYLFPDNT